MGWKRSAARALVTATAGVVCYAVACCVLLVGEFVVAVLCWAVAVAVFFLNALPALFGSGRSLADRMGGTAVRSVSWSEAVAYATDKGQAAWQASRRTAQQLAENERLRRIAESDAARRTTDLGRAATRGGKKAWEGARQGAGAGMNQAADRARQVAESKLGQAAADKGRSALKRARSAVDRRRNQGPAEPSPSSVAGAAEFGSAGGALTWSSRFRQRNRPPAGHAVVLGGSTMRAMPASSFAAISSRVRNSIACPSPRTTSSWRASVRPVKKNDRDLFDDLHAADPRGHL